MPETQSDFQDIREAVSARTCVHVEAVSARPPFHGGFGFAAEYDAERRIRETRRYQVAPISTKLILSYVAEHVPGMPRPF